MFQFNANHQAAAAHFPDARQQPRVFHDIAAHVGGVFHQVFIVHHIQHGNGSGASQVVAAKRGSQHPGNSLEFRVYQYAANRKTVAHAFGGGHQVGAHTGILVREKPAAASVAALHAIQNQHRIIFVAQVAGFFEKTFAGNVDAAHTLNSLHQHGADFIIHRIFQRFFIVERNKLHVLVVIDGRNDVGVVGGGNGSGGAAVEGIAESDDFLASVVERGQFQGVFVGFRAGVAQKQVVILAARQFAQFVGQLVLQRNLHGIGVKADSVELLRYFAHIMRMRVPDGNHCVAAVHIQILLSVLVPKVAALGAYGFNVVERINVE